MNRSVLRRSFAILLFALPLGACLSGLSVRDSTDMDQVDALLSAVERVQVETVVAKERAQAALEGLRSIVASDFQGDPLAAHGELLGNVEASETQAEELGKSVRMLRRNSDAVFRRWTKDLESFANISMRQRSQARLEETRTRLEAVLSSAGASQLALDGVNADLNDYALFLEHDFNAASVALISAEVDELGLRVKELERRLDATAAACQDYVESTALRGQLDGEERQPTTGKKSGTAQRAR